MPFFSPPLPRRYYLGADVQAEIDVLVQDLGLELRSKSRTPIYGPLDCLQVERGFYDECGKEIPGLRVAVRFKLGNPAKPEIDKARALCVALCERNHKRLCKNVFESDNDYSRIPFTWD